jgi:chromosome segregation ATPase
MDERAQIEAAMGRLLDGVPLRSDGKLTIVSLAIEAGLKRHVLTHKHTDLRDRFYAKVKAQNAVPASETALREQNAALRRQLEDLRTERDEYKQAVGALARTLNLLTAENDDLQRQITQLRRRTAPLTAVEARP